MTNGSTQPVHSDIGSDLADLQRSLVRLRSIAELSAELTEARRPAISGWSALEHVAHVSLANELIVRNLHSLIAGEGLLVQTAGDPVDGALEVLCTGVIPRGRAQSPRMVRPPARIDRALLAEWLSSSEQGFASLALRLDAIGRASARVPHQTLGPLTAAQWLRFATIHSRHHLAIVDEILDATRRAP